MKKRRNKKVKGDGRSKSLHYIPMARTLVRNIVNWMDRDHDNVNYYITQYFTGYGYFN